MASVLLSADQDTYAKIRKYLHKKEHEFISEADVKSFVDDFFDMAGFVLGAVEEVEETRSSLETSFNKVIEKLRC